MATFNYNKKYEDYLKEYYAQQDALKKYQAQNNPGQYSSQYATLINDYQNKIANRKPFSYDANSDALYQQYRDQYSALGKLAMQDTMGQAAQLTGGYGNSYAASVGNQAYQQYMSRLADKIPELYQLAASRYDAETNDLYNRYNLYANADATDYGRYRDRYSDYQNELARLTSLAQNERSYAANRYDTDYSNAYNMWRAQTSDEQAAAEMAFKREQYEYEKQQAAADLAYKYASLNAKSSGGSGSSAKKTQESTSSGKAAGWAKDVYNMTPQSKTSMTNEKYKEVKADMQSMTRNQALKNLVPQLVKEGYDEEYIMEILYDYYESAEYKNKLITK